MDDTLKSMERRLLASEDIRLEFLFHVNPLIKEIYKIYRLEGSSNAPNETIQTNVVLTLQLLVESSESFVFSLIHPRRSTVVFKCSYSPKILRIP